MSTPCSDYSALHEVKPNYKKKKKNYRRNLRMEPKNQSPDGLTQKVHTFCLLADWLGNFAFLLLSRATSFQSF